jgi:hypothetical protein
MSEQGAGGVLPAPPGALLLQRRRQRVAALCNAADSGQLRAPERSRMVHRAGGSRWTVGQRRDMAAPVTGELRHLLVSGSEGKMAWCGDDS